MKEVRRYTQGDTMRSLISDDPALLMVLTRFGISLGFGDKTVEEVCRMNGLHTGTFLAVANFISGNPWAQDDINLATMIDYLKNAHSYFLNFMLPMIRRKLIEAIDCSQTEGLGFLIIRFYDEYVTEVSNHMDLENKKVFPYVETLLDGAFAGDFTIEKFASRHTYIDPKLKELKDIIVRYYPEKGDDLLNSALFDIITCEHDLHMHCLAEDRIFVPAVRRLERELAARQAVAQPDGAGKVSRDDTATDADRNAALSEREKQIVCMIAQGLSNKEIADRLCLSIHTVTTHRRNISSKLQIHTPAGLTIFAIVNGLIPLDQIPRPK